MFPIDLGLPQQQYGSGNRRFPMYHLMYRFEAAVSGFCWTSLNQAFSKKSNRNSDLRHAMDFGESPWKGAVERVKGIEPSSPAWEAGALPLSYTRLFIFGKDGIGKYLYRHPHSRFSIITGLKAAEI